MKGVSDMTMSILYMLLFFIFIGIPALIIIGIVALVKHEKKKSEQRWKKQQIWLDPNMCGPVYRPNYTLKKPEHKLSASTVMLLIGTIFIMLSAITFVAANWLGMEPVGRVFTLAGAAVLAFAISGVLKAVVHLDKTSSAFYMIGTLVGIVSFGTAGYYEMFGEWFSFSGMGNCTFLAVTALLASVSAFAGYNLYKHESFHYTAFSFISLAILFLCGQLAYQYEEYAIAVAIAQLIITAVLHIFKPQKNTIYDKPARVIGDITAIIYQLMAMCYVISSTFKPTWYTFAILVILLGQLFLYGFLKNKKWLFIWADIAAIYASIVVSVVCETEANEPVSMLVFGLLTLGIYVFNRFISENPGTAKAVSFVGLIIGAIVCLNANTEYLYGLNLLVPAAVVVLSIYYCLHKSKDIQFIAGIALPLMPWCIAYSIYDSYWTGGNSGELGVLVYGGLALVYIIIAAFFIYLPSISIDFYSKHLIKAHTAEYSAMAAAIIALFTVVDYSEFYFITIALCILHFIISCSMRCNITAAGSVIALIAVVRNILGECVDSEFEAVLILYGLFAVLIILSRVVFPKAVISKENGRTKIDILLPASMIAIWGTAFVDDMSYFLFKIAIAVFIASFVKKNTGKNAAAVLLSVSAFIASCAFIFRPFFMTDSSVISSKVNLAIMVLLGISYRFIWRNHGGTAKIVSTVVFILAFAGLIFDGIIHDSMGNRIFVLAVTAAILIFSFYAKSKTWFTASSIALVILTIMLTGKYFEFAGWWVYLLAVGVIFIAIAAVNEACKKKGESMKETVSKTFSDWTW